MPSLGITSVQFAKSSPTKQSLVWEIMLRQSISVTFLPTNAHIVKQLLAQKLLRITTWLDITGKTNKESLKLCTLFQLAFLRLLWPWRRLPEENRRKCFYVSALWETSAKEGQCQETCEVGSHVWGWRCPVLGVWNMQQVIQDWSQSWHPQKICPWRL